jgi:hypothetical protein
MNPTADRLARHPVVLSTETPASDDGASPWVVDVATGRIVRRDRAESKATREAARALLN